MSEKANKNSSVRKSKQNRLMLLSNCAVCGNRKSSLVKDKELSMISLKWIKSLTIFY